LLTKKNIISGNNFARKADIIFSERVLSSEFPKIKKGKFLKIIEETKNEFTSEIWYINKKITIKKNDTIFCKTECLKLLFLVLKHVPENYELNLITHQSDVVVNRNLFYKKPKCINKWFAVNVSYEHQELNHIPLGISEEFRKKHLNVNYVDEITKNHDSEIKNKIYINFNKNTNKRVRTKLFNKLKKTNFISIGNYGLSIEEYIHHLRTHKYILSPTGNGQDTYRLWESLIIGSNPVVNSENKYSEFRDLPIYFFRNAADLDINFLESKKEIINALKIKHQDKKYLTVEYWINLSNKKSNMTDLDELTLLVDKNLEKRYFRKFYFIKRFNSILKILKFYILQYLNIFNYFRFFIKKLN
jgi:hypothetical protein